MSEACKLTLLWGLSGEEPLVIVGDELDRLGAPWLLVDQREVLATEIDLAVGTDVRVPRLVAFALGALTVVPSYLLGREPRSAGRIAGLLAALFMAASPLHALVNSHIAWSHATTPCAR